MQSMNKFCMRGTLVFALAGAMCGVGGCMSEPQSLAPPVTPEQLAHLRESYRAQDADARVGQVTAVLPSSRLASVGGVPAADFTIGDIITFLDSNGKILAMGKVEAIAGDSLTVRYDPPGKNGRDPVIGDVAVRAIH
jgi:hypothetical protein